jgi:predicted nucleic acid-binding protein
VKAVFDTSPISYLVLIAEIELLPALYNRRFIPTAVAAELGHPKSPTRLRSWIASPPAWLEIHPVRPRLSRDLDRLQMGEREAILLAEELGVDQVVLDDMEARETAVRRGLGVTGLIGILDRAASAELIDLPGVVERLRETSFHIAPWLLKNLLDRHAR